MQCGHVSPCVTEHNTAEASCHISALVLCMVRLPDWLAEDEQFREEKGVIIKEISMLEGPLGEGQPGEAYTRQI